MQIREHGGMFVPVSDALLARVALAGDQKAFATLVQRYHTTMFNFTYRFLGDCQQACDVVQEACLRFYHALPCSTTDTSLKLWLLRMTYSCCMDELRKKSGWSYRLSQLYGMYGLDESLSASGISEQPSLSADMLARPGIQQVVQEAVVSLPPKLRAVIILRSISHLRFEEIGRVLEMPALAVQNCCIQAKMLVR